MWTLLLVPSILIGVIAYYLYSFIFIAYDKHNFPTDGYFGPGAPKPDDETIYPFSINVSDAQIEDLKSRLRNSRVTHSDLEDTKAFEFGLSRKALDDFRNYWLNEYDWRVHEKKLNEFSHFKTQIEGIDLHFVHQEADKTKYKKVLTILLAHGWPGSVYEFSKIIPILVDPKANGIESDLAFNVVAPSTPNYGWSGPTHKTGMNTGAAARIFSKLMKRLNYSKYVVQGGDWGSYIVSNLGRLYPDNVIGVHLNMIRSLRRDVIFQQILCSIFPSLLKGEPLQNYTFMSTIKFYLLSGGYFHIQATEPDTLGVGLTDSPVGLLSWLMTIYYKGTDLRLMETPDYEEIFKKHGKDELFTAISIYWFNGNILNSVRTYKENVGNTELENLQRTYIPVPTAYAALELDAVPAVPKRVADIIGNIVQYSYVPDLGHFACLEGPKRMAKDIFKFAKLLTK
ncbi:unnamed protein product [Bursaphelenchus xylophilus]|uniref:Epoxide hydrolase n=1 Tax=Bursaphelenchus xylophilus TaxID=6326 RepID=A0A1I7RXW0_BURXY|nr:unnamed protein product [Bursaphelenchus xylophilus]CAG9125203.1 unnamed protein product [Bursaphelenchus xylophilus]